MSPTGWLARIFTQEADDDAETPATRISGSYATVNTLEVAYSMLRIPLLPQLKLPHGDDLGP